MNPERGGFKTPILFLTFNRLEPTKIVLKKIKEQLPVRLYIASDGPRKDKQGEAEAVDEIRRYILSQIDWECEVSTLFRDDNLGCKNAVSQAITWFFENEEMGIILEDDCLPSKSFFPFCEELLLKYKDDNRVWHIDGTTPQSKFEKVSYQFSKYCLIWGWATWKRAWKNYDPDIKSFPIFENDKLINSIWQKKEVRKYWLKNLTDVYSNKVDTWDFQWAYAVWINNGISIRPSVNMIKNIGFDKNATHTFTVPKSWKDAKNEEISFPLSHPYFFLPNVESDDICSSKRFQIYTPFYDIMNRILQKTKSLFA